MKLWFVNVECRVRKETRTLNARDCAANPYRTFTEVVVAETENDALQAASRYDREYWYETKRYVQGEGIDPGQAIFIGSSDHDRPRKWISDGRIGGSR